MAKGDYAVPENIRKMKPKGTMVKKLPGGYYVYEYKNVKNKVTGKWEIKMGKLIGSIKEGIGYVPNGTKNSLSDISVFEYGQYAVAHDNTKSILDELMSVFNNEDAHKIYLLALMHLVNGFVYVTDVKEYFEQSYLSLKYPSIKMGYTAVSSLLDTLGRQRSNVNKFEQMLIDNSHGEIAIDGHVIPACSKENDLVSRGNKFKQTKQKQMNVLMAYDIKTNRPLTSKIYDGAMLDKTSVAELFDIHQFKDTLFVVDRGFYSDQNIRQFSKNGNRYIIPLSDNLVVYKEVMAKTKFENRFVYRNGKQKTVIEYDENTIKKNNHRIFVFRDTYRNAIECNEYFSKIGSDERYSEEEYEKLKDTFGTIVLQTNCDNLTAEQIYRGYKDRRKIETFYNCFKNRIGYESLCQQDYYKLQGMSFIMLVVGLMYENLRKAVKEANATDITACLLKMRKIKLIQTGSGWKKSNATLKLLDELKRMNVDIADKM